MDASFFKIHILPCYDVMMAVAVRISGDNDTASDIVQETMKRLWENRDNIPPPKSPRSFCAVAARNAAISLCREKSRHPVDIFDDYMADSLANDDNDDLDEQRLQILHQAINNLDSQRKLIINLSLQGRSNSQIAEVLGVSEVNARQLICRARSHLRKLVSTMLSTNPI